MYERQTGFATFNQHSTKKRLFLFVGHNCDQSEVIIIKRPLTSRNAGTYGIHINVLLNYTRPVFTWKPRSPFLESPETFRELFEWRTSLCIFKTKASRGTKLCSCLNFYSLYNIWKDQLHRVSESEFYGWLFGPEKPSGLSRNGPQDSK